MHDVMTWNEQLCLGVIHLYFSEDLNAKAILLTLRQKIKQVLASNLHLYHMLEHNTASYRSDAWLSTHAIAV